MMKAVIFVLLILQVQFLRAQDMQKMVVEPQESFEQAFKLPPVVIEKRPVYRYYSDKDHFYTTDYSEIGTSKWGQLGRSGYTSEGAGFQSLLNGNPGYGLKVTPVYRYYNGVDHFYTPNPAEIGTTTPGQIGKGNYKSEGVGFWAFQNANPAPRIKAIPIHRYYNGVDHFYTHNANEIGTTTMGQKGKGDYKYEGIGWYAPA